jgi:hypothetical protein
MLFGYQNCSKSKKLQLEIGNSAEYLNTTNLRKNDLDNIFNGLLENEKKERMEADAKLDERINEIMKDLLEFKSKTNDSISTLENKSKELEKMINDVNSDLLKKIDQVHANVKDLETKFDSKLINLDQSLRSQIENNSEALKKEILKNEAKIVILKNLTDEQKKQLIDQGSSLIKLIESYEQFKNLVSVTYATKENLQGVKILYENVSISLNNLDVKIDRTKEQMTVALGALVIDLNTKVSILSDRLNQQGKDIQSIKQDLNVAIVQYKAEIQEQSENLKKLLIEAQNKFPSLLESNNSKLRDELFQEIDRQTLSLTIYTKKAISEISNSISGLDKKINEQGNLSALDRTDLRNNLLKIREEMANAVAVEQSERNKLTDQLKAILLRVQRIELDAKELRLMAEIQSKITTNLSFDFENEKKKTAERFLVAKNELDSKLQLLENSFALKLAEVSKKSEELVSSLGSNIRDQFSKVTSDIAILMSRTTLVESSLKKKLEEFQGNRSRFIEFDNDLLIQKKSLRPHLINSINALSAVQLRFIQILAPDEKTKDFYNESLAQLMESCGGNKAASYANVMGLDSFQLLSLEYARLLTLGIRSSDLKSDSIFHSYGAVEEGNNLSRSLVLALARHTAIASDDNCMANTQTWASRILLYDSRFAELAAKLSNDEELERRIDVFYTSFALGKPTAALIQKSITNVLTGILNFDEKYQAVAAQVSLDLVNDAWGTMLLTERIKNFNDIAKIETEISVNKEDTKNEFINLQNLLNTFNEKTDSRLTALESQVGKLSLSLKKALDVIMTLSDRGEHDDLVLLTKNAGDEINYSPQLIPIWTPKVQLVQHFFSGPQSLMNKSDACSGASILPVAGSFKQYSNGVMNPCWANFRTIPLTNWGNETKTAWLRVFGSGHKINIKVNPAKQSENNGAFVNYNYNRDFNFLNITSDNTNLVLNGNYSAGVFDIKIPDLFDYYVKNIRSYGGVTVSVTASKISGTTLVTGNTLDYNIRLYSPLILDFVKKSMPMTLSKEESGITFDHFGDGKKIRSGWVAGREAGFLLKGPINLKNHKVSGLDLFGEGTLLKNGSHAKDGFSALAQFDDNNDGVINSKDKIFKELNVWFDHNVNAEIDEGEVQKLSSVGVDLINLKKTTLNQEKALNHGNDIRYQSTAMSGQGISAIVYDVFFSTDELSYKK